jgi:hypothetical protein
MGPRARRRQAGEAETFELLEELLRLTGAHLRMALVMPEPLGRFGRSRDFLAEYAARPCPAVAGHGDAANVAEMPALVNLALLGMTRAQAAQGDDRGQDKMLHGAAS